jgi:PAS domain S-box-containing protein
MRAGGFDDEALDALGDALFAVDADGTLRRFNDRLVEATGESRERLVAASLPDLVADAERDRMRRHVERATRERARVTADLRTADGGTATHEFVSGPGADGGAVGVARDVDEGRSGEASVARSRRRFEAVLASPDSFIGLLDPDGTLRRANRTALEFVDAEPDEVEGRPFWELPWWTHSSSLQERLKSWISEAADGTYVRYESTHVAPSGERVIIEGVIRPVVDDEVVSLIAEGRDVTERREYEHELEVKNERLKEFSRVLAHDLRNPLAVARGHFDALGGAVDGDGRSHYDSVDRALDRIDELIADTLELARQGQRVADADRDAVELASVAEAAWGGVETTGARLEIEETARFVADESRLRQVLENLYRNTVEHAVEEAAGDDGPVTVWVGVLDDGDGFYVADDGPGIPAEERDRVFETGFTTKDEGTGYGMASVRRLVAAHDWAVTAHASRDGGARFEICDVAFA